MSRFALLLLHLTFSLALAGCGKELTAGGRQQVEVVATDRAPGAPAAAYAPPHADPESSARTERSAVEGFSAEPGATSRTSASAHPLRPASAPSFDAALQIVPVLLDGTVHVRARAALVHETGEVVQISAAATTANLEIGSGQTRSLGLAQVRTGTYLRVIVAFEEVAAQLRSDTPLGPLFTTVAVAIGAQPLVVERDLRVDVDFTSAATVEVDLNTSTWAALAVGGVVAPELFEAAVRLRLR